MLKIGENISESMPDKTIALLDEIVVHFEMKRLESMKESFESPWEDNTKRARTVLGKEQGRRKKRKSRSNKKGKMTKGERLFIYDVKMELGRTYIHEKNNLEMAYTYFYQSFLLQPEKWSVHYEMAILLAKYDEFLKDKINNNNQDEVNIVDYDPDDEKYDENGESLTTTQFKVGENVYSLYSL